MLVLLATILASGPLNVFVYARGLPFTLGLIGTLAHIPALVAMCALLWVALVKVGGATRAQAGLVWERAQWTAMFASMGATVSWLIVFVTVAGALLGSPLARSSNAISPGALALAALSFVLSSLMQQLSTQSLVIAASKPGERSKTAVAIGTAVFTLAHAGLSPAPLYLLNVALFGLGTTLLFLSGREPRYGLSLGLHAGWNFAQIAVLGAPFAGNANPVAPLRWPAPSLWLGRSNGFDEGLLFALALAPYFALAWRAKQRAERRP